MDRTRERIRTVKCWLCGTPYDFDIKDLLGAPTLRCMMGGDERVRYLQYCEKCNKKPLGQVFQEIRNRYDIKPGDWKVPENEKEVTVIPPSSSGTLDRNWNVLVRKHLYIMGGRCQVCDGKTENDNVVDVYKKSARRDRITPLQRDVIALCQNCFNYFGHRLAIHSQRGPS